MITEEIKNSLGIEDHRVDFYFKVENAVIDDKPFSNVYELAVYVALNRYCNNSGFGFPSLNKLAEVCYCTKPTVIKAINGLLEKGFLKKITRKSVETNSNQSSLYAVKNIRKYSEPVKEIYHPSKGDLQGVVKEIYHPSKGDLPYKELIKNNKREEQQQEKHAVVEKLFDSNRYGTEVVKGYGTEVVNKEYHENNIHEKKQQQEKHAVVDDLVNEEKVENIPVVRQAITMLVKTHRPSLNVDKVILTSKGNVELVKRHLEHWKDKGKTDGFIMTSIKENWELTVKQNKEELARKLMKNMV